MCEFGKKIIYKYIMKAAMWVAKKFTRVLKMYSAKIHSVISLKIEKDSLLFYFFFSLKLEF